MHITLLLLFIAMQIHLLMASPFPGSPAHLPAKLHGNLEAASFSN